MVRGVFAVFIMMMVFTLAYAQDVNVGDIVWSSAAECLSEVKDGRRMVSTDQTKLRVATWNIRWFPDGDMIRSGEKNTDIDWLACTLTWLNVDIVALQEIRNHKEAESAQALLRDRLKDLTGSDWQINLQECGGASSQHVGFLWNTSRVSLSGFQDIPELNGKYNAGEKACVGQLRPGRYAYAEVPDGVDFHIVTVHFDSGTKDSDKRNRTMAIDRIDDVVRNLTSTDGDVIVIGDFNTMGFGDPQSAGAEIEALKAFADTSDPGLRHIEVNPQCTEYYDGKGGWLDHVLVAQSMAEAPQASATVSGYCAQLACARTQTSSMPEAYKQISDHCPVVLEINNVDQD